MSDTVEVIIRAKDEVSKTVSGISKSLGGLGKNLATAGAVGLGAFAAIGGAATAGFGLAIRESINMNASLEQSTMMFTTLMGDADLAAAHVANLFDFAAKTPFNTAEIIAASKHFQVFGGDALNTMENLALVGDAAAAVGAPFDEVAFWTGRMYSAIQGGQPFGEAAMRLQELGLMTPEVRAAMEEMQKTGKDAGAVWGAFSDDMGRFTGAMEMQSQSWNGLMETVKDNLSMAAAEGLRPFFDLAKSGLEGLAGWLSSPQIQGAIQNLAEKISIISGAVVEFIQGLMSGEDPIGDFANLAWRLAGAFGATEEGAKRVFEAVRTIGDKIMELGAPIVGFITQFVSWKDVLIAGFIAIGAALIPVIIGIITAIAPIVLTVAGVIAVVALLRNAWEQNWGGIQEKTAAAVEFIKGIIQAALDFIQQYWAANGARIVAQATADWEALKNAVMTAIETVKTIISTAIANIQQWWADHGAAIVDTATKAWDLVKGVFDGVTKQLNLIGEAFRLAFEGNWEAFGRKIFELWQNAWNTVVDFLRGLWDMVLPWLQSLWQSISGWFSSIDWGSLGRAIIDGIISGLMNAASALYDAIRGIINAARGAAGAAAGEGSPARLFIPLGQNIALGIAEGIEEGENEVISALETLIGKAGDLGSLGSGFEGVFKRQVLDPMEGQLEAVQGQLGTTGGLIQELLTGLGLSDDLNNPWLLNQLQGIVSGGGGSFEDVTEAAVVLGLLEDRRDLLLQEQALQENLLSQQQRLMLMEQQRADLNFLQQQLDLLKLIDDNGLDISILEGIKLGVDADPSGLMQAMSEAMQMMLTQASSNLAGQTTPTDRMGGRSLANEFFGKTGDAGTTVVNIDARGAERGAAGDIRRVVEQVLREQGTRADIRMRTT